MYGTATVLILLIAWHGPSPLANHMQDHLTHATQAKSGVINADLAQARTAASWLADHPVPDDFPENAIDEMRAAAAGVLSAENTIEAAHAVGQIGAACGHCHQLMKIKPQFNSPLDYEVGNTLAERMARHSWAADRMWEALIANSDDLWNAASEALVEAPLSGQAVIGRDHAGIDVMGRQVVDLAQRGQRSRQRAQRGRIYGEFLALCAACHASFRDRSPPP